LTEKKKFKKIEVIHLNDGDHDDDNDENAVSVIISCMKMQLVSRS